MILVDSSVWIDYFRGTITPQTDCLDMLLTSELVAVGDLMLTEVLQGFGSEREYNQARKLLTSLDVIDIAGQEVALAATRNFRSLRALGATVRKTIDTLIATYCIEHDLALLHSDRDFEPFVTHLGLRSALAESSSVGKAFQMQQSIAAYSKSE
jgi:predicted nucleic acid-binding protein